MAAIPECLRSTLELNSVLPPNLPGWVGELALALVDDSNLEEIVAFLGNAGGDANQVFWSRVHQSPRTNEGWEALIYLGGELSDETAKAMKARDKRVAELVRSRFSRPETLVHELFQRR